MTDPTDLLADDRQLPKLVVGHVECSPTIGKIAEALAKAQATIGTVPKGHDAKIPIKGGGSYTYTYASLADSINACRKSLTDNGIALIQPTTCANGRVTVQTMLVHASGEWMASDLSMPVSDNKAQAVGSAVTYARRYALQAFVGLAADDDDGADAQKNAPTERETQGRAEPPKDPLEPLRKRFGELLRERKAEVEAAGHNWADGIWQKVASVVSGLDVWPDRPSREDYQMAIDGLESTTLTEIGLWPAPYDSEDGPDLDDLEGSPS